MRFELKAWRFTDEHVNHSATESSYQSMCVDRSYYNLNQTYVLKKVYTGERFEPTTLRLEVQRLNHTAVGTDERPTA